MAIFVYSYEMYTEDNPPVSLEYQIYREMNRAMRERDPEALEFWPPLIYHLNKALMKLGSHKEILYRGVTVAFPKELYEIGATVAWPAFSSSALDEDVAEDFVAKAAADGRKSGTIFVLKTTTARRVYVYSHFPEEREVLFPPNSTFVVTRRERKADHVAVTDFIHLEQIAVPSGASSPGPSPKNRCTFSHVIGMILDPAVVADRSGRIVAVNGPAKAFFGYDAHEMVGHSVELLMPPAFRPQHGGHLAKYHSTGERRLINKPRLLPVVRKDGGTRGATVPLGESQINGQMYFLACFKPAELAPPPPAPKPTTTGFSHVIAMLLDPAVVADEAGRILETNQLALDYFGYEADELLGASVEILMPPSFRTNHSKHMRDYISGTKASSLVGHPRLLPVVMKGGEIKGATIQLGDCTHEGRRYFMACVKPADATENPCDRRV